MSAVCALALCGPSLLFAQNEEAPDAWPQRHRTRADRLKKAYEDAGLSEMLKKNPPPETSDPQTRREAPDQSRLPMWEEGKVAPATTRAQGSDAAFWIVVVLVGAGVLAALIALVNRRRLARRDEAAARHIARTSPLATSAAPRLPRHDAAAIAALEAGNYRLALRHRYLGLLDTMRRRGLFPRARSLTDRECLEMLRATAPAVAEAVVPLAERFERVWYGCQPCDDAHYQDFRDRVEGLAPMLRRT